MSNELREFYEDLGESKMTEPLIDVKALSVALSCGTGWCYRAAEKKEIPSVKVGRHLLRFRLSDVLASFEEKEKAGVEASPTEQKGNDNDTLPQQSTSCNNA